MISGRSSVIIFVALATLIPLVCSQSIVGTWNVYGNGYGGSLVITSVDSSGNLAGTFFGANILGFYSASEYKITFIRVISSAPSTWQVYVGYYALTGPATFNGYFDAYSGTGATAAVPRYGWTAQLETPNGLYWTSTPQPATPWISGTWSAVSDGYTDGGAITTFTFASGGVLTGEFLGSTIQSGFWSTTTQSIHFIILTEPGVYSTAQHYHGYFSQYSTYNTLQAFYGYFVAFSGTGATSTATEYGWQATIGVPSTSTVPPTQ